MAADQKHQTLVTRGRDDTFGNEYGTAHRDNDTKNPRQITISILYFWLFSEFHIEHN